MHVVAFLDPVVFLNRLPFQKSNRNGVAPKVRSTL
jgi:hypothetical protein